MGEGRRKVLICIDWYEPGYKAGGPIRSAVNFVQHFKNELDIYVFTSDRDLGDETGYSGIPVNVWLEKDHYRILYSTPSFRTWTNIMAVIRKVSADTIYLNSMFSRYYTIYPLLMKKMGGINGRIVLAPRGMLRTSALQHKSIKKTIFLKTLSVFGIMKNSRFQATDQQEAEDIAAVFGTGVEVVQAGNLPGRQKEYKSLIKKTPGFLSILFVGRVHPIKNLYFLLECLQLCKSRIILTVAAPVEDLAYWASCNNLISQLPSNIEVIMLKDVSHDKIETYMINNHIFVLPTAGENFGHAIFEAFSCGRPVLISDQTPWRNLEKSHAGWDIALSSKDGFVAVIEKVACMGKEELDLWCEGAWTYCKNFLDKARFKDDYIKLLF